MKKALILVLALLVAVAFIGTTMAVPPGKTVEFKGGAMGKVVFDGAKHKKAGNKCSDCHPKVFKMKKGADKITMKDIYAGKYCGTCHNGQKAFNAKGNCKKCHQKKRKIIRGC